ESWRSFSKRSALYLDELAVPHLRGAERDLDDVAYVGEFARAGGARILDLLALGDRLEAVERAVDLHRAVVVRDLADVVAHAGPARILALRHREDHKIGVVVGLANVGVERVLLHQRLELGIGRRAARRRRLGHAIDARGGFLAGALDEGRRDAVGEAEDLA